ncbi:MAG: protein phosphatase 2C domain-containing protein [Candidatus Margulisiibacteriota bacterium]
MGRVGSVKGSGLTKYRAAINTLGFASISFLLNVRVTGVFIASKSQEENEALRRIAAKIINKREKEVVKYALDKLADRILNITGDPNPAKLEAIFTALIDILGNKDGITIDTDKTKHAFSSLPLPDIWRSIRAFSGAVQSKSGTWDKDNIALANAFISALQEIANSTPYSQVIQSTSAIFDLGNCGIATNCSNGRPNQEDAACFAQKGKLILAAVFDGIGGFPKGEVASRSAATALLSFFNKINFIPQLIKEAIVKAHLFVQAMDPRKVGTTCAAILIDSERSEVTIAHAGDSLVYLYRNAQLFLTTLPHNNDRSLPLGPLKQPLDEQASCRIQNKNEGFPITTYLGVQSMDAPPFLDTLSIPVLPGDILIACTDGLYGYMRFEKMRGLIQTFHDFTAAQIAEALLFHGLKTSKDNITVAVVKI